MLVEEPLVMRSAFVLLDVLTRGGLSGENPSDSRKLVEDKSIMFTTWSRLLGKLKLGLR